MTTRLSDLRVARHKLQEGNSLPVALRHTSSSRICDIWDRVRPHHISHSADSPLPDGTPRCKSRQAAIPGPARVSRGRHRKPIILLLPDAEVHGEFTEAMIRDIVTDTWVRKWKLEKKLAEWACEWGVQWRSRRRQPKEICEALFRRSPVERITAFQDHTTGARLQKWLLPEAKSNIYHSPSSPLPPCAFACISPAQGCLV